MTVLDLGCFIFAALNAYMAALNFKRDKHVMGCVAIMVATFCLCAGLK